MQELHRPDFVWRLEDEPARIDACCIEEIDAFRGDSGGDYQSHLRRQPFIELPEALEHVMHRGK